MRWSVCCCQVAELDARCDGYQQCTSELRQSLESASTMVNSLKSRNKQLQTELADVSSSYVSKIENLAVQLHGKDNGKTTPDNELIHCSTSFMEIGEGSRPIWCYFYWVVCEMIGHSVLMCRYGKSVDYQILVFRYGKSGARAQRNCPVTQAEDD